MPTAGASRLRLQSVVGVGSGGGVPPQTLTTVTIDELTTVATAYALAQFSGPNGIAGPSPGLENAAATAFSLADPVSGKAGAVVTDQDNGGKNQTLATLGTLANLASLCQTGQSPQCGELLRLTAPPGGTVPGNTVQAVLNPGGDPSKAFTISGDGLNHPFAVQIDGYGRAWVTNACGRRQAREHEGRDPGRQVRRQHHRHRT